MDSPRSGPWPDLELPRGPHKLDRDAVDATHHERLMRAALETVAAQGYARTTVADIVAAARVSKSAFYKLFKDRDDCFASAHETAIAIVNDRIADAVRRTSGDWHTLLAASLTEYVAALTDEPIIARALHNETLGAGSAQFEVRARSVELFVERMRRLHAIAMAEDSAVQALPDGAFQFIVGGIDSLVQARLRPTPPAPLSDLAPLLIEVTTAVFIGRFTS